MITGIEVALAVGIALFLGEVVPVFFYKKGNDV
jgi:hypothetical protein